MKPHELYGGLATACLLLTAFSVIFSDKTVALLWFSAAGATGIMSLALKGDGRNDQ
jgi:hypothetical protein